MLLVFNHIRCNAIIDAQ
jgi:hypothetical protein